MDTTAGGEWLRDEEDQRPNRRPHLVAIGVLLSLLLLGSTYWFGYRQGSAPIAGKDNALALEKGQVASLLRQVRMLEQTPPCATDDPDATRLKQLVDHGRYQEAAALAELVLSSGHHLCPASSIARLWYVASLDALLSTPVESPVDQTPVLTWEHIERQASLYGLDQGQRSSAYAVFTSAYASGIWQLARYAFTAALKQGLVSPTDTVALRKYASTLRNEGHALAFRFSGAARDTGLRLLRTCAVISQTAGLEVGECQADLQSLLRGKAAFVQPVWSDPVLKALRAGGSGK